jgi:ribosomal-protein-alanine N-acetyltransferase
MHMPPLETERLIIRPFTLDDLDAVHQILDIEVTMETLSLDERKQWLAWTVLNYKELEWLRQGPWGDRAVVLKSEGRLIGACGFNVAFIPLGRIPSYASGEESSPSLNVLEAALYYALSPAYWGQGYATEAAQALIDYALRELHLKRIVATTSHDNVRSMGVMERVGMRIERNPHPTPQWFQVVGILENEAGGHNQAGLRQPSAG